MSAFGLYVHIPWCRTKCPYCDFNSHAASAWPERRYTDALIAELRHYAALDAWRPAPISSIFFGGGTPSLFTGASIGRFLEATAAALPLAADAEITLEANPGTVSVDRLREFRAAGVNRISFGIQSFHPHLLKLLGRLHTADDTHRAAPMAREAGFDNLNLDLIFAVPGQTLDEWRSDLDTVIALDPPHVSAYNLTYEEGTAFFEMRREGRLVPSGDDLEAAMFEEARQRLGAAGYRPYEVSNFARPDRESSHNLNYWRAGAYLGLGAGAHSSRPVGGRGMRHANEKDPGRYMDLVLRDGTAVVFEESPDRRQSAGEFAFLNLRLAEGFSEHDFRERFGEDVSVVFPEVPAMEVDALLERRAGQVRLTARGLLLADSVFASFL